MNSLKLTLFGSFQAALGNSLLTDFRTRKVQALLSYLAAEPEPHAREHLLNLLWPGLPEKSARSNLRQILYYLRQAIPELDGRDMQTDLAVIIANRQDIRLNHEADITVDTQQFEKLINATQIHEHLDLYLCRNCRQQLEEAVNLYRGDFLTDFYLDDSNEYEAWAQLRREYFRRRVLDALEILTTMTMRAKEYPAAQTFTEKQLEIDNLRESAYRQLMAILALSGRREQALATYDRCRRILVEELGMEPTSRTTDYYQKILAGDLQFDRFDSGGVRGYELKEQIGEGAYGAIHRAVQPSVKREVAIKVIRRRYADDPEFIRRFDTEAQTIARLEHPYIVPLYDYWRDPQGAYLVMRYMRGGSLLGELQRGTWNVERTAEMIEQIAGALTIAHRQGVVHRDIKPGNILLDEAGNAYLADFGIAKDLTREKQTAEGAVMGTLDYASPEQITGGEITPQTDMYSLGAVIYETLTGEKPFSDVSIAQLLHSHLHEPIPLVTATRPDISPDIDAVLQKATAKVPHQRYATVLEMAAAFRSVSRGKQLDSSETVMEALPALIEVYNPYKGLYAFQESDADDFYGREALVQQLVGRLQGGHDPKDGRFLAVVGPSGSGKSSVVKAGLVPALRNNTLPHSDKWFITEMIPGNNPLEELELALWRVAVNPPPNLVEPMKRDTGGILRTIRRILPDERAPQQGGSQLVLVIDQFEELFTLVTNEEQRNFFLESLLHAIEAPRSPLRVVITLRADFYDRPLQHPQWGQLLKQHTEIVLPLNRTELTWAIREPAQRLGVRLEEGLPAAIVADVADQPGALPLLQYAMTELFERRDGRQISHAAYAQLGGVLGALGRRAEAIYDELDEISQQMAQQVFLRLITLGEGSEDTRRRVLQLELEALAGVSEPDQQALAIVLERFGDARFLTFDRDPLTRVPTVEVAHEALIREWSRLRTWLTESRNDIRLQRLLAQTAAEWLAAERGEGFLLRDARLEQFASWAETTSVVLTANEQAFIQKSLTARQARQAEEDARRQRELKTAQRLAQEQTRRAEEQATAAQSLRQRAVYLGIAAVVSVLLAIAAGVFGQRSLTNAASAEASAATAMAEGVRADAERDVALAARATSEAEAQARATAEAEANNQRDAALAAEATAETEAEVRATAEANALEKQAFAEEQQVLAQEQLALTTSRELALAANTNLNLNPERSLLLGLEALDAAYTVEAEEVVRAALQEHRVELLLTSNGETVNWLDYHPDGTWLAGIGDDGILMIWDTKSGEKLQTIPLNIDKTGQLAISPDGSLMAIASWNEILLLDTNSFSVNQVFDKHVETILSVEFSPDSTLLASGDEGGVLKIWQATTGDELFSQTASDVGWVNDVTFSFDGSQLATGGDDGSVRIWDVVTGEELMRRTTDSPAVTSVAFNADATRLFAARNNATVSIWETDLNDDEFAEPIAEWVRLHDNWITDIKLSPDGRFLATSSLDSTIKLWEADSNNPEEIVKLSGHQGFIDTIVFSPDGQALATTSFGMARIWNVSATGFGEVTNIGEPMIPIAFLPDGRSLIAGSRMGIFKIWDAITGEPLQSFDVLMEPSGATVTLDGRFLAISGTDLITGKESIVKIFDTTTRQQVLTLTEHSDSGLVGCCFTGIQSLDYHPAGTLLATGVADGQVMVWNRETGERVLNWRVDSRNSVNPGFETSPNGVSSVKFSPDGQLLAAGTDAAGPNDTGLIKVWDLANDTNLTTIEDLPGIVWELAFSPDGNYIAGTGTGGFIVIFDVFTGEQIASLEGATNTITSIHWSSDGKRLYTGRNELVVWDIETQTSLFKLPQAWGSLVVSPDNQLLAALGPSGIYIYALDFEEMAAIAASRITRELTDAECKEYLHVDVCPAE